MSTPTERLRALLDGRGAGWSTASGSACYTAWCVEHGIAQATDCGEDGGLLAVMFRCTPEQAVEATLGREETYTREDVEGAFVSGYSLGTLPVGSDPQWDENRQTVEEHMAELGWVRKDSLGFPGFWTHDGTLHAQLSKLPGRIEVTLPHGRGREAHSAGVYAYERRETCEALGFDDGMDEGIDGDWVTYAPPTWHLGCGHTCEGTERPSFCPTCGRRVVEPTWEGDE